MKRLILSVFVVILLCVAGVEVSASEPNLRAIKQISQLPAEFPQRISGFAYDGEKIWVAIYLGKGTYATLDPVTLGWANPSNEMSRAAIREVAGDFGSPGGISFANRKLWIGASYGGSLGSIDPLTWKIESLFKVKQREDKASQMYASMAFDGTNIWIAWHWFRYNIPRSQTQLLLKVNPSNGKVIAEYPAPSGTPNDGTHGLTWDGTNLWHIKDRMLSKIDPHTGEVVTRYFISEVRRPSGLAWVNDELWISEFTGKIWRLPFFDD